MNPHTGTIPAPGVVAHRRPAAAVAIATPRARCQPIRRPAGHDRGAGRGVRCDHQPGTSATAATDPGAYPSAHAGVGQ